MLLSPINGLLEGTVEHSSVNIASLRDFSNIASLRDFSARRAAGDQKENFWQHSCSDSLSARAFVSGTTSPLLGRFFMFPTTLIPRRALHFRSTRADF